MAEPNPTCCLVFLLGSFIAAGVIHVAWLKSQWSQRFRQPIDGGRLFAGQPLFGKNKTWRGFMSMPPALALAFALFGGCRNWFGEFYANGLWPLTIGQYLALGAWVGWAFMFAELPNSFCKRRLGIPPGEAAVGLWSHLFWLLIDRLDSLLGALLALSLVVPVPWTVWCLAILIGAFVHGLFSALLKLLGVKPRAA